MPRSILALALVPLMACGALDEFDEVIVDETTIPATQATGLPFDANYSGFADLDLSAQRTFQNEDVDPNDVDAITIKSLVVEVDTGSDNPGLNRLSSYFESIEYYIEATGQPRRVVSNVTDLPDDSRLAAPVDRDFNLKPYATAESMSFGANIVLRNAPMINLTLRTTLTLHVDINLLGS